LIGDIFGEDAPSGVIKEEALFIDRRLGFFDIELFRETWDYFFLILFAVRGLYFLST
jgi:hypothetical protein